MGTDENYQRNYGVTLRDPPKWRDEVSESDHQRNDGQAEDECPPKLPEQFSPFLEKGGRSINFFGRRAPSHIDGEHVGEKRLADVQGYAA